MHRPTGGGGICGAAMPWSRIVIDYAERTGRRQVAVSLERRAGGAGAVEHSPMGLLKAFESTA